MVPSLILNCGIAEGWEGILRPGSLYDRTGPSVGLEVGILLPGIGTPERVTLVRTDVERGFIDFARA